MRSTEKRHHMKDDRQGRLELTPLSRRIRLVACCRKGLKPFSLTPKPLSYFAC